MSQERLLRRSPRIRMRRMFEQGVVVLVDSAEVLVLNETGLRVLELADGTRTEREIAELLAQEFDAAPAEIAAQVREFVSAPSSRELFE